MVGFAQLVHLLLVLPPSASNLARAILDEVNVVLPDGARVSVDANIVNDELVRPSDGLPGSAGGIVGEVVTPPDIVKVDGPKLDIGHNHEAPAKELLCLSELIHAKLHLNPFNPDIRLCMLEKVQDKVFAHLQIEERTPETDCRHLEAIPNCFDACTRP